MSSLHAAGPLVNDALPLAAASFAPPLKHSTVKKLPKALMRDAEDANVMIQVIEYCPARSGSQFAAGSFGLGAIDAEKGVFAKSLGGALEVLVDTLEVTLVPVHV